MYRNDARIRMLAALVFGMWLTACDESPGEAPAPAGGVPRQATSKVAGLPADMVAAVSAGRSSSVISVHFALGKVPSVGNSLPVEIAIVPHQEFTSIEAHFEARDGLVLSSGDSLGPVGDAAAEQVIKHQLVLLPARDGVYMVTASIETQGADGAVTRIFSIPVIVGGADAAVPTAPAQPAAPAPAQAD